MSGISRYIVLIGAPGVGKGTFAKIFSSQTEWKHLSVGDLLRKEVKNNTNLGKQVSSILSSGGLVSDTLVNSVTKKHLDNISQEYIYKDIYNASKNSTGRIDIDNAKIASKEIVQKYGRSVLLDGYPRTLEQAQYLTLRVNESSVAVKDMNKDKNKEKNKDKDNDKDNDKDKIAATNEASTSTTIDTSTSSTIAIQIILDPWVATQKLLGRQQCITCGDSFNTAHIMQDGYDMPALLPVKDDITHPQCCKLVRQGGIGKCNPIFANRNDDTADIIAARMQEYEEKTAPIVDYYAKRGELHTFHVHKGVKDAPALLKLIMSSTGTETASRADKGTGTGIDASTDTIIQFSPTSDVTATANQDNDQAAIATATAQWNDDMIVFIGSLNIGENEKTLLLQTLRSNPKLLKKIILGEDMCVDELDEKKRAADEASASVNLDISTDGTETKIDNTKHTPPPPPPPPPPIPPNHNSNSRLEWWKEHYKQYGRYWVALYCACWFVYIGTSWNDRQAKKQKEADAKTKAKHKAEAVSEKV